MQAILCVRKHTYVRLKQQQLQLVFSALKS